MRRPWWKLWLFWAAIAILNLIGIEVGLSVLYFQTQAPDHSAIVHYFKTLPRLIRDLTPKRPVGIWQNDSELGFAHVPGARGVHRTANFTATYTIGAEGERYIPAPVRPRGRILFLGCSFTFGHGVNDDQTFPYLLSRRWKDWRVVNKAVAGHGTAHAYAMLEKELAGDHKPSIAIYAMLPAHIPRNYIRGSWVKMLAQSGKGHPHYELSEGRVVFRGLANPSQGPPSDIRLSQAENDLTLAMLREMQRQCRDRGVPFVVVLLPWHKPFPFDFLKELARTDMTVLDLQDLPIKGFPTDGHPNPTDHKRIAQRIGRSFVTGMLEQLGK